MVTSPSLKTRQTIVALFALTVFAAAGYGSYRAGQVKADAEATITSVITPPVTTIAVDEKQSGTATETLISNHETPPAKPFYQDIRYIILMADAVLVLGLLMTLTFRLINRLIPSSTVILTDIKSKKRDHPPTVDELNMDIPL